MDIIAPFKAFLEPWKEMKNLKGSLISGLIYNEIGAVILLLATVIFSFKILGPVTSLGMLGRLSGPTFFLLIYYFLILVPVGLLTLSAIYYAIAELFGGKGSFDQQTFLLGAVSLPAEIFVIVVYLTTYLTTGLLSLVVGLLLLLWLPVVFFFVLKETHQLSNIKTIVVEFTPVMLLLLLAVIEIMSAISVFR